MIDDLHIPETGLCLMCGYLVRNHPGVERVLAARKLRYYDEKSGRVVQKAGIRFCNCEAKLEEYG